ncbi:MAG: SDR family oxidoreductase [Anaerolineae bacterium]|nr:SDR family oxidoreductase [Anaerolineae bacterium]
MFDFSGRVALITGAGGNLGGAVARAFYDAGASLALADHSTNRLANTYPAERFAPARVHFAAADLTDEVSAEALVAGVLDRFGAIDILANTVGGYRAGTPVHETTLETWEFMLALNARSAFLISKAVIPPMLARGGGKIVHVAARAALSGGARQVAYSASKGAVVRLVETLAAELRHKGLNANCVLPGTIDTPQNRAEMPDADFSKWVAPEAIADVILFLASDAARAVNGAAVPVYGRS